MFWEYVNNGVPMLKPLVYYDQHDLQTHYRTDEFIYGNHILVCPILEPNALGRRMYIPQGYWYNFWTNELVAGAKELWIATDYDQIPLFIKEGAVIPKYPVQQYVGELNFDEITLDIYFKSGKEKSVLYEDAQDGYDYNKGRFSLSTFTVKGKANQLIIQQHKEGRFDTGYKRYRIELHGLPFSITEIQLDNDVMTFEDVSFDGTRLIISKDFSELNFTAK
jgi:alpha-glucosidase